MNTDADINNASSDETWIEAEKFKTSIMEKSPLIEDYLQDERDMIEAMEMDMLRLRERYKHDSKKQIEIAHDWFDFAKAVHEVKFRREMIDVETEDDALDSHWKSISMVNTTIQEITKRVEELLNEESNIKKVRERIEGKKPRSLGEIVKEAVSSKK